MAPFACDRRNAKTGTTFFSDMYFYPNIAAEVANQQKSGLKSAS